MVYCFYKTSISFPFRLNLISWLQPIIQVRLLMIMPANTVLILSCQNIRMIIQNPKAIGYKYLTDAILLVMEGHTNNLCTTIGDKYSKTDASVERAMQNAINNAWRSNDIDELLKHYSARINSDRGVPTLTEFVYYYANKIKNDC